MTANLLIAGHIVKDVTADGWRPGGGVLYAASQARRLGADVTVLTACGPDVDPAKLLPDVEWRVQPSEATTTFDNTYADGRRTQRLLARGAQLDLASLPAADAVLLTPLFHEITPESVARIAASGPVLGVAAQGWLRELDGDRVHPSPFEAEPAWLAGDVVFVSDEDVQDAESVVVWSERVPVIALTRGSGGCTVWDAARRHDVSAAHVPEFDPTGAGDVFAAAFLFAFHERHEVLGAARFAAAAGALSVRGKGFEAVAGREEIEALLRRGQVKVA
jgi:sugar/nucleoside kinase (ribokinase family)